jgi:hypothetical protein
MGGVAVDLFGPAVKGSHRRLLGIPSLRKMLIHRRTDMSRDGNTRLGALKARHGHKSVGAIRAHYGPQFAKGCAEGETLSEVMHKLDEPTLRKLLEGHESGELEAIRGAHGVPPGGI